MERVNYVKGGPHLKRFASSAQTTCRGIARMVIHLLAATVCRDWKEVLKRLLAMRLFFKQSIRICPSHYSFYYLAKELSDCSSVLDLGCGHNSLVQFCHVPCSLGVERFEPYIRESKNRSIHTQYIQADVRELQFKEDSFDAVVALELVEHLNKQEGYELIKNMAKWARKKVIISTPNGYSPQGCGDNNPFQIHKSGWEIDELKKLGFCVYGLGGLRVFRGREGKMKFRPEILWQAVSAFTSVLLYRHPELSFDLFCVKVL